MCPKLLRNFLHFMEPEGSSSHSQEPATYPYPDPGRSSLSPPPHTTCRRSVLILPSHLRLGLPSGLLPTGFPTKSPCTPLLAFICATCRAHLGHKADLPKLCEGLSDWNSEHELCVCQSERDETAALLD